MLYESKSLELGIVNSLARTAKINYNPRGRLPRGFTRKNTGRRGFEPRLTDPESVVLPLHHLPFLREILAHIEKISKTLSRFVLTVMQSRATLGTKSKSRGARCDRAERATDSRRPIEPDLDNASAGNFFCEARKKISRHPDWVAIFFTNALRHRCER